MKRTYSTKLIVLIGAIFLILISSLPFFLHHQRSDYYRIVILSDIHYNTADTNAAAKRRVIDTINNDNDVSLVAILGDTVARTGSAEEYTAAKQLVNQITKPLAIIAGNHEFMYDENNSANKFRSTPERRAAKLEYFKNTFNRPTLYYAQQAAGYLLIFLSPDQTDGKYLTAMSNQELNWLKNVLANHLNTPTLIFFHAPLNGTLETYHRNINTKNFIAMPESTIQTILAANPQVKLWISGHTHTQPTNPSFNSPINIYQNNILNIHNPSMTKKTLWTNSLYLYKDKIVIRTYNHTTGTWDESFDRVVNLTQ